MMLIRCPRCGIHKLKLIRANRRATETEWSPYWCYECCKEIWDEGIHE